MNVETSPPNGEAPSNRCIMGKKLNNAALKNLPEGAWGFTTIDLNSNFVGTAREGSVSCSARPLHLGKTTQVWEATVSDDATAKAIAHFRCTQMILWPRG